MKLIQGDCLEKLKDLEDNSIDSIVSDPPYGISFMGKKWDYDVPQVEVWKECLRVLKPGGHALIACGTRTQHRMAVNLEDSGFEIRDIVAWLYGSGFPKSLNIGKAVDKMGGMSLGKEIAEMIANNFDMDIKIVFSEERRKNEVLDTVADITKANETLNWKPNINLSDGLHKIIHGYDD